MTDTIYALSSGAPPSGVAIIRVSGPKTRFALETMCKNKRFERGLLVSTIYYPNSETPIDSGVITLFEGPNSFTGEDVLEFQVHGGRAVVDGVLNALSGISGFRHAEAGEFTYRAFENGKLDLTQAEGIADLIASETENQRQLAFSDLSGKPKQVIEGWSQRLLRMRALIEAEIDFVDEDDIPGSVSDQVWRDARVLLAEIEHYLAETNHGEIIRNGFKVALLGPPNSGKSTLLNALAQRDVAIVTDRPGTTRDVLDVNLDVDGQSVIIFDTAGVRDTKDTIEREGIKRAFKTSDESHLTLWLQSIDDTKSKNHSFEDADIKVLTKADLLRDIPQLVDDELVISAKTGFGMDILIARIGDLARAGVNNGGSPLFSSQRQKSLLEEARVNLEEAICLERSPLEIRSEYLRLAGDKLGMIVGMSGVEELLGEIFSKFCVGK